MATGYDWNYFDKFDWIISNYMPNYGEGETMASQIATAVNKLIYKWFNDGDVYDNTHNLCGWCNDLSDYANWLYKHTEAKMILKMIFGAENDDDYTEILAMLANKLLTEETLTPLSEKPKVDSIYDCDGPFKFDESYDDEEDYYEKEDDEDEDEDEEEGDE